MSLDPNNFMHPIKIGVVDDFDKGTRMLYQTFEDGIVEPFDSVTIVGDDYGPVGMFIPFNANREAIGAVADLFTEIYNGRAIKG